MRVENILWIWLVILCTACNKHSAQGGPKLNISDEGFKTPETYNGYQLVWRDEFEKEIDKDAWTFEIGRGHNGWGNNELQYYTDQNAVVEDGYLVITAKKEDIRGANYSSARMITKGKKEFLFGRIDIRAKIPEGQGVWPALWMLGANIDSVGWPASGEIDIMEVVGHEPNKVYGTMHWGPHHTQHRSKGSFKELSSGKFSDQFHVYSLLWKPDEINVLVDDEVYFTFTRAEVGNDSYPFNSPHYLLFNVAVGGNWPGPPDASTVFPQHMIVDYVRVFQAQ